MKTACAIAAWFDLDFWEVGLVVCFLVFAWILYRLNNTPDNEFSFVGFFIDDVTHQPSLRRLAMFGAFFASTWIVLRQEVYGHLSETAFGVYVGAWVLGYTVPAVAEKFAHPQPAQPQPGGDVQGGAK